MDNKFLSQFLSRFLSEIDWPSALWKEKNRKKKESLNVQLPGKKEGWLRVGYKWRRSN